MGEAVLSVCVNELRRALGDHARRPRYIATVYRRGYQLLARVPATPQPVELAGSVPAAGREPADRLLERDGELAGLDVLIDRAAAGGGGLAVIEGPAGIGKTALLAEARGRAAQAGFVVLSAPSGELERDRSC